MCAFARNIVEFMEMSDSFTEVTCLSEWESVGARVRSVYSITKFNPQLAICYAIDRSKSVISCGFSCLLIACNGFVNWSNILFHTLFSLYILFVWEGYIFCIQLCLLWLIHVFVNLNVCLIQMFLLISQLIKTIPAHNQHYNDGSIHRSSWKIKVRIYSKLVHRFDINLWFDIGSKLKFSYNFKKMFQRTQLFSSHK